MRPVRSVQRGACQRGSEGCSCASAPVIVRRTPSPSPLSIVTQRHCSPLSAAGGRVSSVVYPLHRSGSVGVMVFSVNWRSCRFKQLSGERRCDARRRRYRGSSVWMNSPRPSSRDGLRCPCPCYKIGMHSLVGTCLLDALLSLGTRDTVPQARAFGAASKYYVQWRLAVGIEHRYTHYGMAPATAEVLRQHDMAVGEIVCQHAGRSRWGRVKATEPYVGSQIPREPWRGRSNLRCDMLAAATST